MARPGRVQLAKTLVTLEVSSWTADGEVRTADEVAHAGVQWLNGGRGKDLGDVLLGKSAGVLTLAFALTKPSIATWFPYLAPSSRCGSGMGGSRVASCVVISYMDRTRSSRSR
jgi:hypothetical protein